MTDATVMQHNNRAEGVLLGLGVLFSAATMTSVAVSQITLALLLLCGGVGVWRRWWSLPRTGLEWPILAFVAWGLVTIPFSTDPAASLVSTKRYYLMTAIWVGVLLARDERARAWLLGGLLTGGAANAIYSLATEVLGSDNYSRRIGLVQHSTITGAWLMALAAVFAFAVALAAPSWRARLTGWAALPALTAALFFTWTRSGWLGVAVGFAVVLLMLRPRWVPALIVLLIIVVAAGPANMRARLGTMVDPEFRTNAQRVSLWEIGVDLVRDHPWTGVGDQNLSRYAEVSVTGKDGGSLRKLPHLHQNQLMMAVLWGFPGLILGTWLLIALLRRLLLRYRTLVRERGRWPSWRLVWLAGAFGAWTVINVAGLVDWTFGDAEVSLAFFFFTGAAIGRDAGPHSA